MKAGKIVVEHADFDGVHRLSNVLKAQLLNTFENPNPESLGTCEVMEEILLGDERAIKFTGCPGGKACTMVIRGSSQHIIAEADRSVHDVLCVLVELVKTKSII